MLTGLTVENFKAFADAQQVPIRPITLVFGANSSGKSSIIHSLLLANHGLHTGNWDVHEPRLAPGMVDLGGFARYAHRPLTSAPCHIGFETTVDGVRGSLKLHVGSGSPGAASPADRDFVAIQAIELGFQGQPAFRFARRDRHEFRCERVWTAHPTIQESLRKALTSAAASPPDWGWKFRGFTPSNASPPAPVGNPGDPAANALAPKPFSTSASEREALRNPPEELVQLVLRFCRLNDRTDFESELGELSNAFSDFMAQREFEWISNPGGASPSFLKWADDILELGCRTSIEMGDRPPLDVFQDALEMRDDVQSYRAAEAGVAWYELGRMFEARSQRDCEIVSSLEYLGPVRSVPPRHSLQWPHGSEPDLALQPWKLALANPETKEAVNLWLGRGWLGTPYRMNLRRLAYQDDPTSEVGFPDVQFEDSSSGVVLSHRDLGFGITQVLPILVKAAAPNSSLVAIEQPELHLHPAMQADLGDVFIQAALGKQRRTFVLETHSEHLILRIMRRIRETHGGGLPKDKDLPPVSPSDVAVLYVEKEGPRSIIREFPLNERGELVMAWPGGFFEEGLREMLS